MNIFGLGTPEIILILAVFLLFFGKDKLPGLARSLGRSFQELKSGFALSDEKTDQKQEPNEQASVGKDKNIPPESNS